MYLGAGGNSRGSSPLLSEVLQSPELREVWLGMDMNPQQQDEGRGGGGGLWVLQNTLHPACLNLRNLVWHGFIAPPDTPRELAALACILAASVPAPRSAGEDAIVTAAAAAAAAQAGLTEEEEEEEEEEGGGVCARSHALHDAALAAHFPPLVAPDGPLDGGGGSGNCGGGGPPPRLLELITASPFIPAAWRPEVVAATEMLYSSTAARAMDDNRPGGDAVFVAVAAPALEHALRLRFAELNAAPEVVAARVVGRCKLTLA